MFHSPMLPDTAILVGQFRADFSSFVKATGNTPPVAFANRFLMESWFHKTYPRTTFRPIGRRTLATEIYVPDTGDGPLQMVWAKATYRNYRGAFEAFAKTKQFAHSIKEIDVDHVLARTMLKQHPDAWVALFPVYPGSNRGFGPIERQLPKLGHTETMATLTPLAAVKVFTMQTPRTPQELARARSETEGQFEETPAVKNLLDQAETQLRRFLK